MKKNGVPVVPGCNMIDNIEEVKKFINEIRFPIIIKAASGGGGLGMRTVYEINDLEKSIRAAKIESKKSFTSILAQT